MFLFFKKQIGQVNFQTKFTQSDQTETGKDTPPPKWNSGHCAYKAFVDGVRNY